MKQGILILESHQEVREFITDVFEDKKIKVFSAQTHQSALDNFKTNLDKITACVFNLGDIRGTTEFRKNYIDTFARLNSRIIIVLMIGFSISKKEKEQFIDYLTVDKSRDLFPVVDMLCSLLEAKDKEGL